MTELYKIGKYRVGAVDEKTGRSVNYEVVTTKEDGSPYTDEDCYRGEIKKNKEGEYLKEIGIGDAVNKAELLGVGTVAELRALTKTPFPAYYTITNKNVVLWRVDDSDTTTVDDGNTVLVTASGKRLKVIAQNEVNVIDFGADSAATDNSAAINEAIDYIHSKGGGIVLLPERFKITNPINIVGKNNLVIRGRGYNSGLLNRGATTSIIINDARYITFENLLIHGNGGAFGDAATSLHGVDLSGASDIMFYNTHIGYTGGHGLYIHDNAWVINFVGGSLYHCAGDGVNSLTDQVLDANGNLLSGGQNGNALGFMGTTILRNGGNGIRWSAANLNVSGACSIDHNKLAGVCIDAKNSTLGAYGVNITGNYFEANIGGQVKLISAPADVNYSTARIVLGADITGNYMIGQNVPVGSPDSLIICESNGLYDSFDALNIGVNSYYVSGTVITKYVRIDSARPNCTIWVDGLRSDKFVLTGNSKILNTINNVIVSGMTHQKGIPWSLPGKSDDFLAQATKVCHFSLPVGGNQIVKDAKIFIETDAAAGYTVKLDFISTNAGAVDPNSSVTKSFVSDVSNYLADWRVLNQRARLTTNTAAYLKVEITGVTGGTYMYIKDLILEVI